MAQTLFPQALEGARGNGAAMTTADGVAYALGGSDRDP